ncbi:MAG: coenzyme F420-0:L-glutamate ligase / coenzyme F420:gamma-L-glutamate ligase [Solirubrobacterales bacterium]|nr:coenzyme F420-0:L-glutamate ligase / coenzyme F420:gamma-L-glutamate ligase [Solirubrobacterales bacterium]
MIEVRPVDGIPEVSAGAPLGVMIAAACEPRDNDVIVISQKIVSKAEGRIRDLASVEPSDRAQVLAAELDKSPRLVELILTESREVLRAENGVLIVETNGGLVCANAGIDASNVPGDGMVALLPEDADESARRIRAEIARSGETRPAIVIVDSFGRPWRLGQTEVAIGCAGLRPIDDWRGLTDREGQLLGATMIAIADEVAAAADLARDKASGTPVVVVSGLGRHVTREDGPGAASLRRDADRDLFR